MHENRNHEKCPKCKCKKVVQTGNMAEYPEQFIDFNCDNCGFLVGRIDNSPYVSCYEFKDFVIEI